MNVVPFSGAAMMPPSQPVFYNAAGTPFICTQQPPLPLQQQPQLPSQPQPQSQPQYIMMTNAPTFSPQPQSQPPIMMLSGQAPMVPPGQQPVYFMTPSGALYTTGTILPTQQQIHPGFVPHTAFYVPQENTYVNGGKSHRDGNRSTSSKGTNAVKPTEKKPKSDVPVNHDSLCRHFIQGRCNRRKCRFLHLSGDEAKAYLEAHPSAAASIATNSITTMSQDGDSGLKSASSEKSDADNAIDYDQFCDNMALAERNAEDAITANIEGEAACSADVDVENGGSSEIAPQATDSANTTDEVTTNMPDDDDDKKRLTPRAFSEAAARLVECSEQPQQA